MRRAAVSGSLAPDASPELPPASVDCIPTRLAVLGNGGAPCLRSLQIKFSSLVVSLLVVACVGLAVIATQHERRALEAEVEKTGRALITNLAGAAKEPLLEVEQGAFDGELTPRPPDRGDGRRARGWSRCACSGARDGSPPRSIRPSVRPERRRAADTAQPTAANEISVRRRGSAAPDLRGPDLLQRRARSAKPQVELDLSVLVDPIVRSNTQQLAAAAVTVIVFGVVAGVIFVALLVGPLRRLRARRRAARGRRPRGARPADLARRGGRAHARLQRDGRFAPAEAARPERLRPLRERLRAQPAARGPGGGGARRNRARGHDPVRRHPRLHAPLGGARGAQGRGPAQRDLPAGLGPHPRERRHDRQVHRRLRDGLLRRARFAARPRAARRARRDRHPAGRRQAPARPGASRATTSRKRCRSRSGSASTRGS